MIRLIIIVLATAAGLTFGVPFAQASTGTNPETMTQFVRAVQYEATKYGTGFIPVIVADLDDPSTMAETNGYVIILSSTYASMTPQEFNASVADDIASGYQPGGCDGISATAIHEMGHVIDGRRGMLARRAVAVAVANGQIGSDLHGYAYENGSVKPGEAVAVSFQAVECGSATATEQAIYNVLVS